MKVDRSNSWKEKIDPAFDDLIKAYLDYINSTHICSTDIHNRFLYLKDKSLKVIARNGYPPLPRKSIPNLENFKNLMKDTITIGASPDSMLILKCFKNMAKPSKKVEKTKLKNEKNHEYSDDFKLTIYSMIKELPREDSRNYYKKRLGIDLSPEEAKSLVKGKSQKELKNISAKMREDISCLMLQAGFKGYLDSKSDSYNDKKINELNIIKTEMQSLYNTISIITYKKPLGELYEEARKNDGSLYKAIHLDKTLFDEDWVRKRIRKAFYSGDSAFLKKLGEAIEKPPINVKLWYGEVIIILSLLWPIGLYRLNNRELMGLLKASGVPMPRNHGNFKTYIKRLKKHNVLLNLDKLIMKKVGQEINL